MNNGKNYPIVIPRTGKKPLTFNGAILGVANTNVIYMTDRGDYIFSSIFGFPTSQRTCLFSTKDDLMDEIGYDHKYLELYEACGFEYHSVLYVDEDGSSVEDDIEDEKII